METDTAQCRFCRLLDNTIHPVTSVLPLSSCFIFIVSFIPHCIADG